MNKYSGDGGPGGSKNMPAGGEKIRERGAETNTSPPGEKYARALGGGISAPKEKMPLGGHQIGGARPFVRGNHIEGALAPQAAGQRNGPWENDEKMLNAKI